MVIFLNSKSVKVHLLDTNARTFVFNFSVIVKVYFASMFVAKFLKANFIENFK